MAISKVGLGWPSAERQYTTLAAWFTALKASGTFEEAWCSGDLGAAFVAIGAADFAQGALIRGDVQYTGANHTALAKLPRTLTIASANGLVVAQDLWVSHSVTTQPTVNISASNYVRRLYIDHSADPGSNAAILMTSGNAVAEYCIVRGLLSTASKAIRPSSTGIIRNCVGIGTKYALFSEWTNSKTERCYGIGASISSCLWGNGRPPANITNASEDATGDVGYQNLDPVSNFVDYANGDYRIRTTSPLYSAGIGAFFEPAANTNDVSVNATYTAYSASVDATVTSPEINATITTIYPQYTSTVVADNIDPQFSVNISVNYPKYLGIVEVSNTKPENNVQIVASYSSYTAAVVGSNTKPIKTVNIVGEYSKYEAAVVATAQANGYSVSINTTYPKYVGSVVSTNIKPIKDLSINVNYPVYTATVVNSNTKPIKEVSINSMYSSYTVSVNATVIKDNELSISTNYPNYSAGVVCSLASTDKTLSINATYPKHISTVVIGDFLSLPYRGGKGAHLVISLGSREVIFKDKSRNVKWRVENARL